MGQPTPGGVGCLLLARGPCGVRGKWV